MKISVLSKAMLTAILAAGVVTAHAQEAPAADSNISAASSTATALRSSGSNVNLNWTGGGVLSAESTANASSNQTTTSNVLTSLDRSPNRVSLENGAGAGISGNIGINLAAGSGNLQGNATSIASTAAADVFSSANTVSRQTTLSNFAINVDRSSNEAVMDAALAGATGNIGLNLAVGVGNAQSNQLSMSESGASKVARAGVAIEQSSSSNQQGAASRYGSTDSGNTVRMMSGALVGASGNIGVSIAAGVGNAQTNALSVSVVR
jgi:hypothetical protein